MGIASAQAVDTRAAGEAEAEAPKLRMAGPQRVRASDASIAHPSDMSLEYEPGKPFKNFGRRLAWEAGFPLPYNMEQAANAAEQRALDYQNQTDAGNDLFDRYGQQVSDHIAAAGDDVQKRMYGDYLERGMDAALRFNQNGASDEQRTAALSQLEKLDGEVRTIVSGDVNERQKFARQFLTDELRTTREGLMTMDMADKDRVFSTEADLAQLENVRQGSAEEQILLRTMLGNAQTRAQSSMAAALKGVGGALAAIPSSGQSQVAGAVVATIGAVLANESTKLDRDTVVQMILEANQATDNMTNEFRPEVVRLHEKVVADANDYGIPATSWSATPIRLQTPYTDAWKKIVFPGGGSGTPNPQTRAEQTAQQQAENAEAVREVVEPRAAAAASVLRNFGVEPQRQGEPAPAEQPPRRPTRAGGVIQR